MGGRVRRGGGASRRRLRASFVSASAAFRRSSPKYFAASSGFPTKSNVQSLTSSTSTTGRASFTFLGGGGPVGGFSAIVLDLARHVVEISDVKLRLFWQPIHRFNDEDSAEPPLRLFASCRGLLRSSSPIRFSDSEVHKDSAEPPPRLWASCGGLLSSQSTCSVSSGRGICLPHQSHTRRLLTIVLENVSAESPARLCSSCWGLHPLSLTVNTELHSGGIDDKSAESPACRLGTGVQRSAPISVSTGPFHCPLLWPLLVGDGWVGPGGGGT